MHIQIGLLFEKYYDFYISAFHINSPVFTSKGGIKAHWKKSMTAKLNFRKDVIEGLTTKEIVYSVVDLKTPYLHLKVFPSGVKTFVLCRKVKGVWQRIKIGRTSDITIEQARKEALRLNSLIGLGQDPHAEKQAARNEITFKELFEIYYSQHALLHTKRPKENKKIMEFYVLPTFGKMKASEITAERIRRVHAKIAETHANSTANRVIAIVSPVFNFCIKNAYFKGTNPCTAIKKFRTASRDRFLSLEELEKFFEAVKKEEDLFQHFFLMLLYTGARKSNVLSMKWADIDFKISRWRISETETKNREVNIIPLCAEAIEILEKRVQLNKSRPQQSVYVFPGDGVHGYLIDPKRAFDRVRSRMGVSDFRMHDLRRTLGSYMAISGSSLPIIGKALNHKSQVSTAIYARLSQAPVMDAITTAVAMIKGNDVLDLFKLNTEITKREVTHFHFSMFLN